MHFLRPAYTATLCAAALVVASGCALRAQPDSAPGASEIQALDPAIEATVVGAAAGQAVHIGGAPLKNLPEISYELMVLPGPQYLISDDPEYIRVPEAVALREEVNPGAVRLYVYNVNGVKEPEMERVIAPVIRNLGDAPLRFRMLKYSAQEPSANYYAIGKRGLRDYFRSEPSSEFRTVPVGGAAVLDPYFADRVTVYNDLVHGFYDFVIDQPAEVAVVQVAPGTDPAAAFLTMEGVLPTKSKSGAGRGIFGVSEYEVLLPEGFVLDSADGARQIVVADNENDPWVRGRDHTIEQPAVLAGNYGVMYHLKIPRTSSDGRGHALLMYNYRAGGQWCAGMAASVLVNGEAIEVPSNQLNTKGLPEAVVVQTFDPVPAGETEVISITYSPPGASCLPTPLVLVPIDRSGE